MNICMAGSGNVATVLSRLMMQKGHRVVQVLSRHAAHAEILAAETGASAGDLSSTPHADADIIIIAVSDSALTSGSFPLKTGGKLVVHTAGSVARNVLDPFSSGNGILYPLQTLRKELQAIPQIPFLIDGSDEQVKKNLKDFAMSLSGMVQEAGDEERLKLHAAAVIVNNFTNHLYALAGDFCAGEGLDFSLLHPLIKETAARIDHIAPSAAQTGPAARNDLKTISTHLELLEKYPALKEIYRLLSESIRIRHT